MGDYGKFEFHRQIMNVDDEPSVATPYASFDRKDVTLMYWANTRENYANKVKFHNCPTFRIGDPNDEGFYSDGVTMENSSIYNCVNFPDLEFDGLYEISGSNMDQILSLNHGFIYNPNLGFESRTDLKHYLFFMKDATFECFASGYTEQGLQPISMLNEVDAEYTGHRNCK